MLANLAALDGGDGFSSDEDGMEEVDSDNLLGELGIARCCSCCLFGVCGGVILEADD